MDMSLPTPGLPPARLNPLVERFANTRTAGAGDSHVDPATRAKLRTAANDFESQFVSQMVGQMFEGVEVDETFGGGHGEEMFRSLLVQEYGKSVTARGGFGLADQVYRELLRAQEASNG